MTFDEYWNSKARRDEIPNDLLSHDLARAAYEAGARSRDEEVRALVKAGDALAHEIKSTTESPLAMEFLDDWRAALKETKP